MVINTFLDVSAPLEDKGWQLGVCSAPKAH